MSHAATLPVEVAAILWADAYRETLRLALARKVTEADLAALDRAIARIEQYVPSSVSLVVYYRVGEIGSN